MKDEGVEDPVRWTLKQLAERAEVACSTLAQIENGRRRQPHAPTLGRLARALGLEPSELLQAARSSARAQPVPAFPLVSSSHPSADREFDRRCNPLVEQVAAASPDLFAGWSDERWQELHSQFGVGGALTEAGVRAAAEKINARNELFRKLAVVLETDLHDVAADLIDALYRRVRIAPEAGLRT